MGDEDDGSDLSGMNLSGMSDQDLQQLVGQMGSVTADPEKQKALQTQLAIAKMLREGASIPSGHMAGKVYVGTGPLQAIAGGLGQGLALKTAGDVANQQSGMAGNEQNVRSSYLKALLNKLRGNQDPSESYTGDQSGMDMLAQAQGDGLF
jgi:hypothetical protein